MSDLKITKFEMFIEEIDAKLERTRNISVNGGPFKCFSNVVASSIGNYDVNQGNTPLTLIFDYKTCNEYAKAIIHKSHLPFYRMEQINLWKPICRTYLSGVDMKKRIDLSQRFVGICKMEHSAAYYFIFWALMILAVDQTDAEEHLALICDFAKMLKVTEEEFEDIIEVVKRVYHETDSTYIFKSDTIFDSVGELVGGIRECRV